MQNLLIALFILLISSKTVWAADSASNYAIWGVGKKTCFSYTKARKENAIDAFRHYTMGYLTASNFIMEETYSISNNMSLEEILVWIDGYCEKQPMSSYENVLIEFSVQHFEKRKKRLGGDKW